MTAVLAADDALLSRGCTELGLDVTDAQRETLLRFVDLIYERNEAAGLTAIPREHAIRLHILDSLAARRAIERGPCLDMGTGAGLPGLALAIADPTIEFVLVESNRRRFAFLQDAVRVLGLSNVHVLQGDIRALPRNERYPTVTSRAFRPPVEFLRIARRIVQPAGRVVVLLAEASDEDLAEMARASRMALEGCERFRLPTGNETRTVARFTLP